MRIRPIMVMIWGVVMTLTALPVATTAIGVEQAQESEPRVVSGTLLKLDLENNRGVLRTDLGGPIYFDVPKAYLFENVIVGARISLRLDEEGRAIKVMDSSIPDVMVTPERHNQQPLATSVEESLNQ
jgi:hypothetical protein